MSSSSTVGRTLGSKLQACGLLAHTGRGLNKMMYLAGSYENPDSLNCVQVFNAETQTWKPVPRGKRIYRARDFQGKVYENFHGAYCRWVLVVKLKDSTEGLAGPGTVCLIEKRFYRYESNGGLLCSINGTEGDGWKKVEGLEGLPKFARYSNVNLVESGCKMLVFWDKYVPAPAGYKEKMIWCAEISLEMRSEEIWGKVEWFDAVLTVPKSYKFVYACSATV
ncbi:F-box/kelch-repeat protein [Raphanus sativus]|nr:F-box/kelch-repeat protein [Raphanus sativus]